MEHVILLFNVNTKTENVLMVPNWTRRKTQCRGCSIDMEPGEQRLSMRYRKGEKIYSLHYHRKCGLKHIIKWWEDNPYVPSQYTRTSSDMLKNRLTPDQIKQRGRLVSSLSNLWRYYTTVRPIHDRHGIIHPDRVTRFYHKYRELCGKLGNFGRCS